LVRPFTTLEAQPRDRALELVGRRFGIGGGQRGKTREPIGMGAYCLVEAIIGPPRQWHGGFRIQLLKARHRMRQHLHVDAGLVHFP
jgi:hypothetical protein